MSIKKTMNRKQFRQLVFAIFSLFLAIAATSLLFPSMVPSHINEAVQAYQESQLQGLPFKNILQILFIIFVHIIGPPIGLAGLFFFRRSGRSVLAIIICTMPLANLFVGLSVSSWVTTSLLDFYLLGVGFALAVAWFSPLKEEFQ